MIPCHICDRFVRDDALSCPFCEAPLASERAPVSGLAVALGFALTACGPATNTGDEGNGDGTEASTANTDTSNGMTSASATATETGRDTLDTSGVAADPYAGPGFDTTADDTSVSATDTDTSTGTGADTDTDTGTGTGTGTTTGTTGS